MNATEEFLTEAFKEQGLASQELIDQVLAEVKAQEPGETSGDEGLDFMNLLLGKLELSKEEVVNFLGSELDMEVVDMAGVSLTPEIIGLLNSEHARFYEAIPLGTDGASIDVVLGNPLDQDGIDNLGHLFGKPVNPRVAYRADVIESINQLYGLNEKEKEKDFLEGLGGGDIQIEDNVRPEDVSEEDAPIIKFVHSVIKDALEKRASDIHMEPLEKKFRIRFRIDGKLIEQQDPPKRLQPSILSRTKLMANVSLAEKRVPLDGRINVKVGEKVIDLRVSTLPTVHGESIVMRILDKESLSLGLPQLGFFSDDQTIFEQVINLPDGIFLVTGPTGSGKSTTLYSALNAINKPDRKIITVEDPVEYEMEGIGQVQVKEGIGYTFEEALRSFLRQDPEVILVGEIRDKATVDIALKAALTGHLVFSTLHTNDAPSSITRLLNMGTPNYLISAALTLIMAQRLARKTCLDCRVIDENITPKLLNSIGFLPEQSARAKIYKGNGCESCTGSGYKGRMGIYEILEIENELKAGILSNLQQTELNAIAKKNGFRTMQDMGQDLLLSGDLSFAEYERVLQSN